MSINEMFDLFRVRTDQPGLMQAKVRALSRQIPLLLFITVVNTLAVAFTHLRFAPFAMTVGFPLFVTIGYAWHGREWWKLRNLQMSDAEAGSLLKLTIIVGPACTAVITAWGLSLYHYGDLRTQGHVLFYTGVTVVSCAFCMMNLRPAAILMMAVVMIPFSIFFLSSGDPVFITAVISMLLVSAAIIYVLLIFSRDFVEMISLHQSLVESREENARLANTDSLTELPNRRMFVAALDGAVSRAAHSRKRIVAGLIDLDGFKAVSDLYGHATGDIVLIEASRRMRQVCDDTFLLARIGGDEFGLIVEDATDDVDVLALGGRICQAISAPFAVPGIVVDLTAFAGFSIFPEAGTTAELLWKRADFALYHAKQGVCGCATIFSFEHETKIRQLADLEQSLRRADLDAEMSLQFQPIVDVELGRTIAFEALARWVSPTLGRVPPDVFIRIAERSDFINKLSTTLLRRALAEARVWPSDIRISFNLSARDLTSVDAMSDIAGIIKNSELDPGRIDLEVTETTLIRDFEQANVAIDALRALGVGISLDDFGTGYSSLSYLGRFHIDKIKIDRSFIKEVETDASCRALVKSVIDMSRNLQLNCIVEGAETANQVKILRSLGCTTMQGYYFGKPMPSCDVLDFLHTKSWTEPSEALKLPVAAAEAA